MRRWSVCPVWHEDWSQAETTEADTGEHAAENYVQSNLANLDYPDEVIVRVRLLGRTECWFFAVRVTMEPVCMATLIPREDGDNTRA